MSERLRIGVVGCGAIARQVHLPLLRRRADVQLVAMADNDPNKLPDVVLRYRGVPAYTSMEDMLADGNLDAVVITLPTGMHAAAARAALAAGLHVFVEKPLADSLEDAGAVLDAWRQSGRVGVVGFNCRANPLNVRLRELVGAGRAGEPAYMRTVFATARRDMPAWKRHRATGGGALLDLGAHHIDLLRFIGRREISGVHATITSRITEHDTVLLDLEFDGGVLGHAFFSLAGAETDHVEVHGDRARLSVRRFTSLDVDVVDNPGPDGGGLRRVLRRAGTLRHLGRALRARRAPLREPGYAALLDGFIRAARGGAPDPDMPGIADGFACAAVIDAAERSAESGRMEAPAPVPTMPRTVLR
ncbi:N/A [soil metagenome]